ncbi:MAG: two-component regulator propeller domain-containing protein, partial [Raineya sp.]
GLKSEYINHIFQDSKGFIWLSSDKGLSRYDGKEIFHLNTDNGLPANMVYAIWEENNKIFFNVYEKGVFAWNGEKVEVISKKITINKTTYLKQIKSIPVEKYLYPSLQDTIYLNSIAASYLKDYENNEWISVFSKGLFRFIPYLQYYPIADEIVNFWQDTSKNIFLLGKNGIYIFKNNAEKQFVPLKDARAIDFYQGKFYLASLYNYYKNVSSEQLFSEQKLPSVHCTGFSDILHTADTLWIGSFGEGVLKITQNRNDTLNIQKNLVSNNIERLQKTPSALWASTYGNGVSKITFDGKITNFNQEKGLLSNIVYFVFEDTPKKDFWIANEKGITIFDASNQKKLDIPFQEKVLALHYFKNTYWAVSEKYLYEIKNYKPCKRAGIYLLPPDMQFAINRVFAENEKIYIVGSQGLSVLDLEKVLAQSSSKPRLQILELKTKTKKLDLNPQNSEIILDWRDNFLKISLATLSFLNEKE